MGFTRRHKMKRNTRKMKKAKRATKRRNMRRYRQRGGTVGRLFIDGNVPESAVRDVQRMDEMDGSSVPFFTTARGAKKILEESTEL
jgi:hypothetical protein